MRTSVRTVEGGEEETEINMVEDYTLNKLMLEIKIMVLQMKQMAQLHEQMSALQKQKPREVMSRKAGRWICRNEGYIRRDCPCQNWTKSRLNHLRKPAGPTVVVPSTYCIIRDYQYKKTKAMHCGQ